jgi:hypothetical protein
MPPCQFSRRRRLPCPKRQRHIFIRSCHDSLAFSWDTGWAEPADASWRRWLKPFTLARLAAAADMPLAGYCQLPRQLRARLSILRHWCHYAIDTGFLHYWFSFIFAFSLRHFHWLFHFHFHFQPYWHYAHYAIIFFVFRLLIHYAIILKTFSLIFHFFAFISPIHFIRLLILPF